MINQKLNGLNIKYRIYGREVNNAFGVIICKKYHVYDCSTIMALCFLLIHLNLVLYFHFGQEVVCKSSTLSVCNSTILHI